MHPMTAKMVFEAHVRDLQRSLRPERSKRRWRPLAWIREGR